MKKRVWFNRTFSTAYHNFDMIRNNPNGESFEIFATHPKKYSITLQGADFAEVEPTLDIPEYIDYCVDFCRNNKIDVFVPTYRLVEVSKHLQRFDALGTRVLVSRDSTLLENVSDKGKLFEMLKGHDKIPLPHYYIVSNVEDFKAAYRALKTSGCKVCLKPSGGVGGIGFYIIKDHLDPIEKLFGSLHYHLSYEDAIRALSSRDSFDPLMVMEYLEGYEYSIDCLAYEGEVLVAVPRKKVEGRIRELEKNEALIDLAKAVHDIAPLPYLFNVQVKYTKGTPKLLEINPRASGGLYVSCLSGVNFPYLAVKLLLDGVMEIPAPRFGIYSTHIEKEITLHRFF